MRVTYGTRSENDRFLAALDAAAREPATNADARMATPTACTTPPPAPLRRASRCIGDLARRPAAAAAAPNPPWTRRTPLRHRTVPRSTNFREALGTDDDRDERGGDRRRRSTPSSNASSRSAPQAHISAGELVTVIGAIGDREHVANLGLEGAPGVDHLVPILKPYKLASLAVPARRAHRRRDRRAPDRRRPLRDDRRALHGRVARGAARRRPHRQGRRRPVPARRRLQAAHVAVLVPGPRRGGPAPARRGQGGDRPADRHRADGRARPRRRCSRWPT